jgi:hypothetical protein
MHKFVYHFYEIRTQIPVKDCDSKFLDAHFGAKDAEKRASPSGVLGVKRLVDAVEPRITILRIPAVKLCVIRKLAGKFNGMERQSDH